MIFIDTSYFVALTIQRDALHEIATAWSGYLSGPFITTEYVLVEYLNMLSMPSNRHKAHQLIAKIGNTPCIQVIPAGAELFGSGLNMHTKRVDKYWSLTDCISFVVMRNENLTNALTNDRHFEQAGFKALLRQPPPQQA